MSDEIEIEVDGIMRAGLAMQHWTQSFDGEVEAEWWAFDGDIARWEIEAGLNGWRLTSLTWASPRGEPLCYGEYGSINEAIAVIRDHDSELSLN